MSAYQASRTPAIRDTATLAGIDIAGFIMATIMTLGPLAATALFPH